MEAQAQMTSDAFSALEKNLTTFTTMFNNFAVQLKQTDDGTIDSLLHDIAALNATISQCVYYLKGGFKVADEALLI